MASLFRNASLLHHKDAVRTADGGQPVGDHDNRLAFYQFLKSLLNQVLIVRICKCGCLIQQNDGGIL